MHILNHDRKEEPSRPSWSILRLFRQLRKRRLFTTFVLLYHPLVAYGPARDVSGTGHNSSSLVATAQTDKELREQVMMKIGFYLLARAATVHIIPLLGNGREHVFDDFTLAVHVVETERVEVIQRRGSRVDLDATQ